MVPDPSKESKTTERAHTNKDKTKSEVNDKDVNGIKGEEAKKKDVCENGTTNKDSADADNKMDVEK